MLGAVRRIVRAAHPDRVILFGSAARGDIGPDSDLDFLVIKSGAGRRRDLARKIYRSLFGLRTPVDVIVRSPREIQSRLRIGDSFFEEITREGRIVYAQQMEDRWFRPKRRQNDLALLEQYAVEIRYPGATATPADAKKAVAAMERVVKGLLRRL